jgi:hypothetical protein
METTMFNACARTFFCLLVIPVFFGCSGGNPVQKEIRRVEAEGWSFQEMVGKEIKDTEPVIHMNAENGRTLTVNVVSEGKEITREYQQITNLYYASIFMSPQGGAFALIFSRPK